MSYKNMLVASSLLALTSQVQATHTGSVTVNENWVTVTFPYHASPVVIIGSPTNDDTNPATIQLRNVTNTSFEVSYQSWDYLKQQSVFHGDEDVAFLVMEEGQHTFADGTRVDVGTVDVVYGGSEEFTVPFRYVPQVFITPQEQGFYNDGSTTSPYMAGFSARSVTKNGFIGVQRQETARYDQNANIWTIPNDTVSLGYIAVETPLDSGQGTLDNLPLTVSTPLASEQLTGIFDGNVSVYIQEENSLGVPGDTAHGPTTISVMKLQDLIFASDIANTDVEAMSIRRVSNEIYPLNCKGGI